MAGFYETLNRHYDQLFPVEEEILTFLLDTFRGRPLTSAPLESGPIVDAACGTGNYTDALNREGLTCVGFDQDTSMIYRARSSGKRGKFLVHDLRELATLPVQRPLSGLFCIGNSLPHLPDRDAVARFFLDAMELQSHTLVIQTINFARFAPAAGEAVPLPPINRPGVTMRREYLGNELGESVAFRIHLETTAEDTPVSGPVTATVPMVTLDATDLTRWARDAGYTHLALYGDFNGGAYVRDRSFLILLVARR